MEFEWDETKNITNVKKHGITFDEAQLIFDDPFAVIFEDNRFDYGEIRFVIIGKMYSDVTNKDILVVMVYTERGGRIRIISARKASKWERKLYE